jgi:anti-anti-sigma factor
MAEPFDITRLEGVSTVALHVSGNLDARNSPKLVEAADDVRGRGQNLILVLTKVPFIASSGIGALLAIVEDFSEIGRSVRLAALSPEVESVIQLLNLDQFLTIDGDEEQSRQALEA